MRPSHTACWDPGAYSVLKSDRCGLTDLVLIIRQNTVITTQFGVETLGNTCFLGHIVGWDYYGMAWYPPRHIDTTVVYRESVLQQQGKYHHAARVSTSPSSAGRPNTCIYLYYVCLRPMWWKALFFRTFPLCTIPGNQYNQVYQVQKGLRPMQMEALHCQTKGVSKIPAVVFMYRSLL